MAIFKKNIILVSIFRLSIFVVEILVLLTESG